MKSIDWDDFRMFAAVARNGNLTRAARELRISEPTMSRRIRRLEDSLGVKLFAHSGRDAHLTSEGHRVLSHTSAAEYAITQATDVPGVERETSVCKLMAGDGLATYWLPQFLPPFMEQHPQIDIALFSTPDRYGPKPPLYDLRVQYAEASSEDLICIRLATMHFTLFASRKYLKRRPPITQLSDLAQHRVLDLALDISEKGMLTAWARLSGRTALFTNLNGALCETVRYGGGVALLPSFAGLLDSQTIAVLPGFSLPVPLFLCFDRETGKRPAVRAVIDYLRDAVFDRRTMPWFADGYEPPSAAWAGRYRETLARAQGEQKAKKGR